SGAALAASARRRRAAAAASTRAGWCPMRNSGASSARACCRRGDAPAPARPSGPARPISPIVEKRVPLASRPMSTLLGLPKLGGAAGPALRSPGGSPEDAGDGLLLDVGDQVAVAATLLVRLVADELVDDPLVHAGGGQAADEAVPQHVVA